MSKKNIIFTAFTLASVVLSANASAQIYAGITAGAANWNLDCSGANCDKSSTPFRLLGGYDLSPNFGVEAGYFSMGKVQAPSNVLGYAATSDIKGSGVDISGVLKTTPASGFVGFAKLGFGLIKGETSEAGVTAIGPITRETDKRSVQPVFGLGVTYAVAGNLSLRGEIENREVKFFYGDKRRVALFSIGAQMAF